MKGSNRHWLLAAGIAVLLGANAAPAGANAITQVGCVNPGGTGGCADSGPLLGARSIAIAPDGLTAYLAQPASDSIAVFDVDPVTGALSRDGSLAGNGLKTVVDIAISANGEWLAAASNGTGPSPHNDLPFWDSGVSLFERDAMTGDFEPASCLNWNGVGVCDAAPALGAVLDVEIDATGRDIYALSWVDGPEDRGYLAVLRNDASGFIQSSCFATGGAQSCAAANALKGPTALALAPDGEHVYAATWRQESIAIFDRNPGNGTLTTLGCVAAALPGCSSIDFLDAPGEISSSGPSGLAFAGDTRLYLATRPGRTLGALVRNPATGGLSRHQGSGGCVTSQAALTGACTPARAVSAPANHEQGSLWETQAVAASSSTLIAGTIVNRAVTSYDLSAGGAIAPIAGTFGCTAPTTVFDCAAGTGFDTELGTELAAVSIALSPDGRFAYAAMMVPFENGDPGAVLAFEIDQSDTTAPACTDRSVTTPANTAVTVPLQCTDVDGDALTLQIAGGPASGNVGPVDSASQTVEYTPASGFSGQATFTYRATASGRQSAPATVTVTVQAPSGGGSTGGGGGGSTGGGTGGGGGPTGGGSTQPTRLDATIKAVWRKQGARTILRKLRIAKVPAGAGVELRCKGKGCPFKTKRFAAANGKVNASRAVKTGRLRAKAKFEVRITRPGATGIAVIYKVTRRGVPKGKVRCLPPGATAPVAC